MLILHFILIAVTNFTTTTTTATTTTTTLKPPQPTTTTTATATTTTPGTTFAISHPVPTVEMNVGLKYPYSSELTDPNSKEHKFLTAILIEVVSMRPSTKRFNI